MSIEEAIKRKILYLMKRGTLIHAANTRKSVLMN